MLSFDPFRNLDRLVTQLNSAPAGTVREPRFMPMDLYKADDHYVLTADLPGVDPGSVDLTVDRNTLTVSAERTLVDQPDIQWLTAERPYGTYRRQIALGDGIDVAKISATYQHGVLCVTIPLAETGKPRSIDIEVIGNSDTQVTTDQTQAITAST